MCDAAHGATARPPKTYTTAFAQGQGRARGERRERREALDDDHAEQEEEGDPFGARRRVLSLDTDNARLSG